jgi:hypothetical protein
MYADASVCRRGPAAVEVIVVAGLRLATECVRGRRHHHDDPQAAVRAGHGLLRHSNRRRASARTFAT